MKIHRFKRVYPPLLLMIVVCLISIPSFAQTFTVDGLIYEVSSVDDKTVILSRPEDRSAISGDLVIPASVQDPQNVSYTVTAIGYNAFSYCSSLTSVTIPNSVTLIDCLAFYECRSLISVTIPNSVISIGISAFGGCQSLTSVTIPDSVSLIGAECFVGCSALDGFYGKFASEDHRCLIVDGTLNSFAPAGLTSYEIPNSVTSIGANAFGGCLSLTSVIIPNSVTIIGDQAFCTCESLTSVTIPNSVTSIGVFSFANCKSLISVAIPDCVSSIGASCFAGCDALDGFYGKYASEDHRCLIVDGTLNSFAPAGLTSYEIPNSVTSIGDYAFSSCTSLTSVTIPNSVISIGELAFNYCLSLISVTIPNSVISIGRYAFSDCTSLTSATFLATVFSIGDVAFSNCSSLKELFVSASTPPACVTSALDGIDLSLCTLYVPEESIPSYQSTEPWQSFINIKKNTLHPDYSLAISSEILLNGQSVAMPVTLINPLNVVTVQFDLYLPEGITLDTSDTGEFIVTPGERCNSTHVFTAAAVDNFIRVVGYSTQNMPYSDADAPIIYLPLSVDAGVPAGRTKMIEIRDIYVTLSSWGVALQEVRLPDSHTLVRIIKPGDVNCDGRVSTCDIAQCLALILGQDAEGAIPEAADVNGDGKISATDIACIVHLIMAEEEISGAANVRSLSRAETDVPVMYMHPVETATGSKAGLEVCLSNPDTQAVTMQCDVFLPEGVEIETDAQGDPVVYLSSERSAGHVVIAGRLSNGAYRVISYSDRNRPYNGDDGVVFTLPLDVKAPAAQYDIRLENSYVTEAGTLREFSCPDSETVLTVTADTTGIYETEYERGNAEYYTLQGVKVESPNLSPGVYICRVGNTVTKVLVK